MAQWEREIIAGRTRDAMRAKKQAGGVRYGRRSALPADVLDRIERLRDSGLSMWSVAEVLNADGVPTATGCNHWYAASVRSALSARANDRLAGLISD